MKPVGVVEVYTTKSSHSLFLQKVLGTFDEFDVCLKMYCNESQKSLSQQLYKSCYT